MKAEAVAGIKITINVVMMSLAASRFYVMYFKQRRRSIYDTMSHILLWSAIMVDNGSCGTNVWVLTREIQAIKDVGMPAANKAVGTHYNLKLLFAAHFFYYTALCVIKLAYLVFYAQLFRNVVGRIRYVIHVAAAIWVQSYTLGYVIMFAWCMPFSENMRTPTTNPHCPMIMSLPAFEILAAANIFSDIAIALVPILLVGSMRLGKLDKRGLIFIFGVGSISIIASIARLIVMTIRLKAHRMDWDSIHVLMLWCHAEIFFGVLAFMLPSFRFLLTRAFNRFRTSSDSEDPQMVPTVGHASPRRIRNSIAPLDFSALEKTNYEIDINERNLSVSSAGMQSDITCESDISGSCQQGRKMSPVHYV